MESSKTPKFRNKSERNAGFKTQAQIIFEGKKLLEARPPEMDKDTYRLLRKMQTEVLKNLFHKGHSPNRKLQGIMGVKQPTVRFNAPVKRVNTPRKTS